MENNWYIYRHLKPCGEVFYIGIGKIGNFKRAYEKYNRNNWWKNVISKFPNYEVQILTTGLSRSLANEIEVILISHYRRKDCCNGTLVNMTDGGDGSVGNIPTEETRLKRSIAQLGELNHMYGKKGELNPNFGKPKHSDEQKERWSEQRKGTQIGEDNPFYGRTHTEETINKIINNRRSFKGENNPMFGKSGESAPSYGRTGELHPMFGKEGYWKDKKLPKSAIDNMKNKGGKIILDIETGVYYLSIREAADYSRLSYSFLQKVFKGHYKNYTSLRLV